MSDEVSDNWIDRTRRWMRESGTSQGSLARALDCTRGAVGHYLAGRRQPTLTQMERIAGVMEVHPAWLLYGIGQRHKGEAKPAYPAETTSAPSLQVMDHGPLSPVGRPAGRLDLRALSERCYGYRVESRSVTSHLQEGEVLVLDPQSVPQSGDEVLVGFTDRGAFLYRLISIQGDRLTLGLLNESGLQREYKPREISFMHRVIAVVRRGGLPMSIGKTE